MTSFRKRLGWCLLLSLGLAGTASAQTTLYGAESGANSPLYVINQATGQGTAVGNIGVGVSALDIHPLTGVLYGVSAPGGSLVQRNLLRIDTTTGLGTVVGSVGLGNFGIADMAFRSDGTLFAWSENSDDLITINVTTGAGTIVGNAAIGTAGSGLAFSASGTLYLAGERSSGALRTVNPATGLTTIVATLTGSPAPGMPIAAMKFHPVTGVLYAINRRALGGGRGAPPAQPAAFVRINETTGVITNIGAAPPRLDALAFGPVPVVPGPVPSPGPGLPPTLSGIGDQMVAQNGSTTVPFTIAGAIIPGALHVSLASSNTAMLPVSPSTLTATCTAAGSCTLRIAPADGRAGTARVTVTVTDGVSSTSVTFTVTVVAVRPSVPAVVLANVVGSGIVVTWAASDTGTPMAYAIAWGTASGASNLPVQLVPGTETRFEFSSLPAGTYFFRVYAVGAGDLSAESPQTSATITGSTTPGPPLALVAFPGSGNVNASWMPPNIGGAPSIYEIGIGTTLGSSNVASATTAALSFGTGAAPGNYWVRTRAASGGAVGAWSSSVHVPVGGGGCAGAPGAPILLPVTTTSGRVTFTWWPGNGVADSYQVLLAPGAGLAPIATFSTSGPGTSLVWPATEGRFAARVVAVNGCGSSTRSNEVPFTIVP